MSFILLGILSAQAGEAPAAGAYDLLETQILTSSASSVTFTGLGSYSDYKHLQIRAVMRMSDSGNGGGVITMRFNNATSGYAMNRLVANGTSLSSGSNVTTIAMNSLWATGQNSTANAYGAGVVDILDFSNSNKNTTLRGFSGATSNNAVNLYGGLYPVTTAVTSITILESANNFSFTAGTRFSIYGMKG